MYLHLPTWKGLPLKATKSAYHELEELGMDLSDAVEILEQGYDCLRSKRQEGVYERCLDIGDKTVKIVVGRCVERFTNEERWSVIHVGEFTRR